MITSSTLVQPEGAIETVCFFKDGSIKCRANNVDGFFLTDKEDQACCHQFARNGTYRLH